MRMTLLVMAAAAALAGCTFKSTTVRRADATPPPVVYQPAPTVVYQQPAPTVVYQAPAPTIVAQSPPTIAYTVSGQAAFNQAAIQAADWCRANHATRARLIDTTRGSTADVVTFECVGY